MGLGSYWGEVIDVLREIIPVYDKVNSFISLGKDVEHRNRAIKGRVKKGDKILDAGSGFGNMSKTAAKIVQLSIQGMNWIKMYKTKSVINEFTQFENKLILSHPNIPVVATGGFLASVKSFILFLFKLYTSVINVHKQRYC